MRRRYWPHALAALLFALLLSLPWLAIRWQNRRQPDAATLMAVARWADAESLRRYGPSRRPAWLALQEAWQLREMTSDPRLERLVAARGWSPTLEEDFRAFEVEHGAFADGFFELAREGNVYQSLVGRFERPPPDEAETFRASLNFLQFQLLGRLARLAAERDMAAGRWFEALDRLDRIVALQRAIAPGSLVNRLVATALHGAIYDGYVTLTGLQLPPEALDEAFRRLGALREVEPRIDALCLVQERLFALQDSLPAERRSPAEALRLLRRGEKPRILALVTALARERGETGRDFDFAAARRYLLETARTRPEELDGLCPRFSRFVDEGLDAWTLLLLCGGDEAHLEEARMRSLVLRWRGELLETALRLRAGQGVGEAWPREAPLSEGQRYRRGGLFEARLWHPGPDGRDDGAAFSYDPTNGTLSAGDLILNLGPERTR